MTNKLKTLKDLKFQIKEIPHAGWLTWQHELREEAKKWIITSRLAKVPLNEDSWIDFFNLEEVK